MREEVMRDAERSKNKILDAAEQLFATKGFNNTSLAEIGEYANLSRATPTYYFKNKPTLYKAVLLRLIDDEREFVKRRDLLESDDIVGRVRELLCTHIDFIFLRPTYVQLICREALDNNGFLLSIDNFLAIVEQGKDLIELARNRGIIVSQDSDSILMYSLSITWFPFLQKDLIAKSLKIDPFSKSFLQRHKDFVTTTFIQSLFKDVNTL
ncbi:TetR/AcrR family transcriptional regulator [Aminipila butyrica]|uniref:TetR/AcrR family transcriptional regulator n=1 Tax=Aminipila butyrica TaxID=433296 RepID=A0A858BWB8_9FIRM|nr:TetR/AcrR family transcriptional regulator [Aminipila butyrica]QIB69712.1 TetR/AcrR family transcriptional regulator [Aminipila butyrica]